MLSTLIKRYILKQPTTTLPRTSFSTKLKPEIIITPIKPMTSMTKNTVVSSNASAASKESTTSEICKDSKDSTALQIIKPIKKTIAPYKVVDVDQWRNDILTTAAQHKYTISPAIWDILTRLPPNILTLSGVPTNYIKDFSRIMTIKDCIENKMPMESVILLAQNMFITPGEGVAFTQNLFTNTRFFENLMPDQTLRAQAMYLDYTKLLPWRDLVTLPNFFLGNCAHMSIKTQSTLGYEIRALVQVNRHLVHNRLGFTFRNTTNSEMRFSVVDPFTYEAYMKHRDNVYDQTQNQHPDYVLVLAEPVVVTDLPKTKKSSPANSLDDVSQAVEELKTHPRNWVTFDLKFGQIRPAFNIVKSCENEGELVKNLLVMHDSLIFYLRNKKSSYNSQDEFLATTLVNAFTKNRMHYMQTRDIASLQATYYRLYDTHTGFFLRNNIGFNFLVNLPASDLRIPEDHVSFFSSRFRYHATTRGTVLSDIAETISKENASSLAPGSHVEAFVHEMFKKNPFLT